MVTERYDVFIIDGSIEDWLQDDAVQAISFDGLQADTAEALCRLALERGYTCTLTRKKVWVKDGDADGSEEGGAEL